MVGDAVRRTNRSPFVVLDKAYYVVLLRRFDEFVVVLKQLDGGLRDQDMQTALDSIQRDAVVSAYNTVRGASVYASGLLTIRGEDDHSVTGRKLVNSLLV